MRTENHSLQERRLWHQARLNAGQKEAQLLIEPDIPTEPLPAVRETLKAVLSEIQQRRLSDVKDHQRLAHARRLILLTADLEREQAQNNRPPWWRRWRDRLYSPFRSVLLSCGAIRS